MIPSDEKADIPITELAIREKLMNYF